MLINRANLLDGGDTDGSLTNIINNSSSNAESVISDILGDSPWVSVPVVQTIFEQSQNFTEQEVATVLVQNPGVLDDNYINSIVFQTNSFSQANQQAIIQALQTGDERMDYEASLLSDIYDGTLHIKDVINAEIDNLTFNQSIIRSAVASKLSYSKLYQTIESYLKEKDYSGAQLALNAKLDFQNFDPHLLLEKSTYNEIIQMGAVLELLNEPWSKLSQTDFNRLVVIANNYNGKATVKARSILEIYYDMEFGSMPVKPFYNDLQFSSIPRSLKENVFRINVYPNPTSGLLNIELDENFMNSLINIYEVNGKQVLHKTLGNLNNRIDVSGLISGIYLFEIIHNGKVINSNKLFIID